MKSQDTVVKELQDSAALARETFGGNPTPNVIAATRAAIFSWKKADRAEAAVNLRTSFDAVRKHFPEACAVAPGEDAQLALLWFEKAYQHERPADRAEAAQLLEECCKLAAAAFDVKPDEKLDMVFVLFDALMQANS